MQTVSVPEPLVQVFLLLKFLSKHLVHPKLILLLRNISMPFVRMANITKPSDKVLYNLIFISFITYESQVRNGSGKVKVLFMLRKSQIFSSLPQRKLRFMCWEYPIGLFGLVLSLFFSFPCSGQEKAQWLLKSKHMTILQIYPKYLSHFSVIHN